MDVPDPMQECQDRLAAMRAGNRADEVTPEEAERGLVAARGDRSAGFGGRQLGWGLIKAYGLNGLGVGDRLPCWFAISDGEHDGAVLASLSGSDAAAASNQGEVPAEVLWERLRAIPLENPASHFLQVALNHPLHLS